MEQSLGQRSHGHQGDGGRARVLPEDGHLVGVTAELADVGLDPVEDHDLVQEALVTRGCLVVSGEEAEWAQPVVEGDQHHVLLQEIPRSEEETCASFKYKFMSRILLNDVRNVIFLPPII